MNSVRRLIYRLGFRPRPGSIFYSPSLHYLTGAEAAVRAMKGRDHE